MDRSIYRWESCYAFQSLRCSVNRASVTAEQLCDAGFYYSGFDDQVRCFYCAGGIREWSDGDDPWEEHARWLPDCSFLLNKKGKDYVDDVHNKTPDRKKLTNMTKSQMKAERQKEHLRTTQEEMRICCQKLGHSDEDIDRVLVINGKPFDDVKDMIDALYSLESDDNEDLTETISEPSTEQIQQPSVHQTSQHVEINQSSQFLAGCRLCEVQKAEFVDATHVGLPCGHLIYCESCNTDEQRKSSTQQPKCPQCSTSLTGTIKVHLA